MARPIRLFIVVGTRPNFIKITQFERAFQAHPTAFDYRLIHTGQHFDQEMSAVFFETLHLKKPDVNLNIKDADRFIRLDKMTKALSELFAKDQPDLVIVVGDVDSTLAAARAATSQKIRLAHIESGLRSFDQEMPEEVNRIEVDQLSDVLFVTEQSGLDNLKNEGYENKDIHFVGNTMIDTLVAYEKDIQNSSILQELNLAKKPFILATLHRPRNVDNPDNLKKIIEILDFLAKSHHIVLPLHPRTSDNFRAATKSKTLEEKLIITPPLDYLSFQKLVAHATLVLTDSGGVQEETTFRKTPCITLRPNTERPSTIDSGSNQLLDIDVSKVKKAVENIESFHPSQVNVPPLWDGNATNRIVQILSTLNYSLNAD